MPFAILAAAALHLAAPDGGAPEALARERAIAFADALQSGAALPDASPKIVFEAYWRPRYKRTASDPARLRATLAGCRRGDSWVYVYGPSEQYVAIRYHCPSDPQSERWPVLEQEIEKGQIAKAWVATGPRQLDRERIRAGRSLDQDGSFAADRAAALALISAIQAGRASLPHARPSIPLVYSDHLNNPEGPVTAAVLRRLLAGCTPGTYEAESRRWLGSRLAMVPFTCPQTHKPHPEMAILVDLLDGRVQSFRLEAGPPPPPIMAVPAKP
ncbi:MAG TPA: hypothetical protein VFQ67_04385 [Allosphingosinicella sp.]|jgi:hypothetical protein|nr:hypothetical protein [Allosphingosinicella sp.]